MVMSKVIVLVTGMLIWASVAIGQEGLKQAFEQENSSAFNSLLDSKVDLYILGKENYVSRADAVKSLESFFATHKVTGFKLMHSGESRGQGSNYQIHQLQTDKGAYRVYTYVDSDGGKKTISELRIEKN